MADDNNGAYTENYTYDSAGRLLNGPLGINYTYGDPNHLHAVTAVGANGYGYDPNGNLSSRTVNNNLTMLYSYDAENRLTNVSGAATASFVYDGDGARVKGTVNGVTTIYLGNHYEVSGNVARKYYYAGNQRVAMREGTAGHLWLFNDHLGSTGYTYNATTKQGELRYKPFGSTRYTWGTTPTSYRYTGQREEASLGIYYYGARWYDLGLGRFIQPDTIVPNPRDAKAFDRYSYVANNPLKYVDPTGYCPTGSNGEPALADPQNPEIAECWRYANTILNLWDDAPDYWNGRYTSKEEFRKMTLTGLDSTFFKREHDLYLQSDAYKAWYANQHADDTRMESGPCTSADSALCGAFEQIENQIVKPTKAYCNQNDCLSQAGLTNDGIGIGAAAVVVICAPAALGCAGAAAVAGTIGAVSTGAGLAITGYAYANDKAADADLTVTTVLAAKAFATEEPHIGLTVSIVQGVWDFARYVGLISLP